MKITRKFFTLFFVAASLFQLTGCGKKDFSKALRTDIRDREVRVSIRDKNLKESIYVGETEVTQKLYEHVMGNNPSVNKGDSKPVEYVSWYDALMFCNNLSKIMNLEPYYKIKDIERDSRDSITSADVTRNGEANGYRLLDLEEFSKLAAAKKKFRYPGSDDLDAVAWYNDNSLDKTHIVGTKKPDGHGIYDLFGNVWEWTDSDFKTFEHDKKALYGGTYHSESNEFSFYAWAGTEMDKKFCDLGFRICRK